MTVKVLLITLSRRISCTYPNLPSKSQAKRQNYVNLCCKSFKLNWSLFRKLGMVTCYQPFLATSFISESFIDPSSLIKIKGFQNVTRVSETSIPGKLCERKTRKTIGGQLGQDHRKARTARKGQLKSSLFF